VRFPDTGGAAPLMAEWPNRDMTWLAQTTPACGVSSCPIDFTPLSTNGPGSPSSVAAFPSGIDQMAVGPPPT
jgi:hypothetical protein